MKRSTPRHPRAVRSALASSLLLLGFGSMAGVATAQESDKLVIEAGRILTRAGSDIVDGVIVIENGRIQALGPKGEIERPWDAPVVGGPEFTAFPGFIEAHSSRGMDRPNENVDVAPFLDVRDSVDPVSFFFEDCLRWGITTVNVQQGNNCVIGARGMVVRPVGMTIEEMVVKPTFGVKISAAPKRRMSRSTQMQTLRGAFDDLRHYLEDLVQKERDERGYAEREALFQGRELDEESSKGRAMGGTAWKVEGLEIIPRGAIDDKQEPLLEIVEGRRRVFFYCGRAMDVSAALNVAREQGFLARTALVLDESCWEAADLIAEAGVPVILDGDLMHVRRDRITGEEIETFVPQVLADKGIRFAISSDNSSTTSLWYQAALAVGHGLSREAALDAVTRVPAEILGLGDDVGSLEVGKLGNVVLLSGDPLGATSWVEHVVIEGREVYDRSTDVRNRQLLEGTRPPGTGPARARDFDTDSAHGDEDSDEGEKEEVGEDDHGDEEGDEDEGTEEDGQ